MTVCWFSLQAHELRERDFSRHFHAYFPCKGAKNDNKNIHCVKIWLSQHFYILKDGEILRYYTHTLSLSLPHPTVPATSWGLERHAGHEECQVINSSMALEMMYKLCNMTGITTVSLMSRLVPVHSRSSLNICWMNECMDEWLPKRVHTIKLSHQINLS